MVGEKQAAQRRVGRRGQGHRASPGFSQGQISFGAGMEAGLGMGCHLALATHQSLSLLCHLAWPLTTALASLPPRLGQGCACNMAPASLEENVVARWGQLGICAARTGPWGKYPAASSLALINLLESVCQSA